MENFFYSHSVRIWFGNNCLTEALEKELPSYGSKVMLCFGYSSIKKSGLYDKVHAILEKAGKTVIDFGNIMPNPSYAKVQEGAEIARKENIDLILAVGGGSVSDCSKMIAAQALCDEDIWDMEIEENRFPQKAIPVAVVVTASGTGSEQNNDAVITHEEKKIKCDLYGLLPEFSILDPSLTLTVPMTQVMAGAFDSLSHAMETYFGKPSETFITDEINEAVMRNIICNMRKAKNNPNDVDARGELMWASAIAENGLLKLGKKGDFQCHMIEHQLGAYTDCSHGLGLAVLHPVVYTHLLKDNTAKFRRFAEKVWDINVQGKDDLEIAGEGISALKSFIKEMGLPLSFTEMGIADMLDLETIRKIAQSTIIRENCARQFSPIEILQILKECL